MRYFIKANRKYVYFAEVHLDFSPLFFPFPLLIFPSLPPPPPPSSSFLLLNLLLSFPHPFPSSYPFPLPLPVPLSLLYISRVCNIG